MVVNVRIGNEKADTHPSMYKLVEDSSFNCSILALNESDFELVRVLTKCG